jgi:hypothetical protein
MTPWAWEQFGVAEGSGVVPSDVGERPRARSKQRTVSLEA